MPTVLVIANILHLKEGDFAEKMKAAGFDLRFPANGHRQLSEVELASELADVDATIAGSEPYTAAILARFPKLRVISRTGVGYDSIDMEEASRRKVAVAITPGANQDSVAEHAFALLLATARNIVANHNDIANGGFERPIPAPLRGRTLGLIGYGRTGRATAIRALAFGMDVVVFDPFRPSVVEQKVEFIPLDDLFRISDYISLHAPLTADTKQVIRAETIAKMKPHVRLVNTSRGGLINEADLVAALKSKRIAGAALDVFIEEPPPVDSPLRSAPNIVLAPHLAGIDADACERLGLMAAQNIVDLYEGRLLPDRIVNASAIEGWKW